MNAYALKPSHQPFSYHTGQHVSIRLKIVLSKLSVPPPSKVRPSRSRYDPTPLADAAREAQRRGWISSGFRSALYASAGQCTKAPVYLRPEVLTERGLTDVRVPEFMVYADKDQPFDSQSFALSFDDDDRTMVETVEVVPIASFGVPARLLRVHVASDRFPDRQVAVLRLKIENEDLAILAIAEDWSPEWFIGICDGCAGYGGNMECDGASHCENEIEDYGVSIPLRLGVRYWVTDHFSSSAGRFGLPSEEPEGTLDLPSGARLRQVAFLTSHWDSSNFDCGSRIFEVRYGGKKRMPSSIDRSFVGRSSQDNITHQPETLF
jgi:hypothetical protein